MSRPYVQNPDIFKRHFIGKAMPYFKGQRIQRDNSALFSMIKRLAVPLLSAAAPHIAGAASSLARKVVKKCYLSTRKCSGLLEMLCAQVQVQLLESYKRGKFLNQRQFEQKGERIRHHLLVRFQTFLMIS